MGKPEQQDRTEVYDEMDFAQMKAQESVEAAIEAHKAKTKPEKHPDFDGIHCVDCEAEMHPLRLEMGRVRCVDCQEHIEKLRKHYPNKTFN